MLFEYGSSMQTTRVPTEQCKDDGNANKKRNSNSNYRGRERQRVRELKPRLQTTARSTGRGIETAVTANGNANRMRNSKSAYRPRESQRVQEFKQYSNANGYRIHPRIRPVISSGISPLYENFMLEFVLQFHPRSPAITSSLTDWA
jgi:hypothetical protein